MVVLIGSALAAAPTLLTPSPEPVHIQLSSQWIHGSDVTAGFVGIDAGARLQNPGKWAVGFTAQVQGHSLAAGWSRPTYNVRVEGGLWGIQQKKRGEVAVGVLAGSMVRDTHFFRLVPQDSGALVTFAVRSTTRLDPLDVYVGVDLGVNTAQGVHLTIDAMLDTRLYQQHVSLQTGVLIGLQPIQWLVVGPRVRLQRNLHLTTTALIGFTMEDPSKTHLSPHLTLRYGRPVTEAP